MNFSTADRVADVVSQMQIVENLRAEQRALLNEFFNGKPLWTTEEQEQNHIEIAFNNKSGSVLLHNARAQYSNAFLRAENYFTVSLPNAPQSKARDYGTIITREINRIIKKSRPFYARQKNVFAGVCLHGIGAKMWWDDCAWLPHSVGVQDILMPTDTETEMDDSLQYFAVKRKMKPGSLFRSTLGISEKNRRPEWNMDAVKKVLEKYKDTETNPNNYDWSNNPEQMAELLKQNTCYYESDSAPVIWMWDFFHREEESKNPGWYRKIILDKDSVPDVMKADKGANVFIYEDKVPCARKLDELIHFQFGDGNNVPPFMYHSIRSLAFLTYELLWTMNRLQCQWTQHVFEQMLTLFRVNDPTDRSRLAQVVFSPPWGIVPDGLDFVKNDERYVCPPALVEGLSEEYKGLISSATEAYSQNVSNTSGDRERVTKAEIQAKMAQTSQLMSTLIQDAYRQEEYAAREIARRFTLPKTDDFDVKRFQNSCREQGVPAKWLDSEQWDVEIEQSLGGGNRGMELLESQALLEIAPSLDPSAQQEVKHDRILAVTNNAKKAARLAPLDKKQGPSDAVKQAEADFTLAMTGIPPMVSQGLNHIEQIARLLQLMGLTIQQINQTGGVGTPQQFIGLNTVGKLVAEHLQILSQDRNQKQVVKKFSDILAKFMNLVRAFGQRQQAAMKKRAKEQVNGNGNGNGSEILPQLIKAKTDAAIKTSAARQKMRLERESFNADQHRQTLKTISDIAAKANSARMTSLEG